MSQHFVQLYEDSAPLAEAVAEYVREGLRNGEAALIIATAEHRAAFLEKIPASEALRVLDAEQTLAQLMVNDKPSWSEIRACGHWLELELAAVRPELVVCLGATAAQAMFGRTARVGAMRGRPHELTPNLHALVTIHPSAVLRAGDAREERRADGALRDAIAEDVHGAVAG